MIKAAWLTDIHLDSCADPVSSIEKLSTYVNRESCDIILISGDISTSGKLVNHLLMLESKFQRSTYFVTGNHDAWYTSFDELSKKTTEITRTSNYTKCLQDVTNVRLSNQTMLVGHGGWYDMSYGDPNKSSFVMGDWITIHDFMPHGANNLGAITAISRQRAYLATDHVMKGIKNAVKSGATNIVVMTHVPPFSEVSKHGERSTDIDALPFYVSKTMGDMLRRAAAAYPQINFTVLCGHTHTKCFLQIEPNMAVHVGGAAYKTPQIQNFLEFP